MKKKYVRFDFHKGYPSETGMFYECNLCDQVLESNPSSNVSCKCGNIRIDVDAGRVVVRDNSSMKIFRI